MMKPGQLVMLVRKRSKESVSVLKVSGAVVLSYPRGIVGVVVEAPPSPYLNEPHCAVAWRDAATSYVSNWQIIPLNDPDADLSDEEILNKELESV